jgi:predicted transcriptional regulator
MNRESLHNLVNRIPEAELSAAQRYLEYLASSPAYRAAKLAPVDDEPVTEGDAAAIRRSLDDVRAGRVVSHDEVLREFGLK